ncbi:MAG: hypothetical protein A4E57_00654 [Syntrophorhabdaceae bacterium PtaU1.Bin034]|nr:MAG: hypothetical protein A4E57_00654 [Syntrophorhabdaceae bacterium PtaU1.Bin034]
MDGERQIMKHQNHRFSITGTPAPTNLFFALKCFTSDPLPMVRGTRRPQTGRNPDVPAMFAREGDSPGLDGKSLPLKTERSCRLKTDRNQLRSCSYDAGIGDKKVQFRLGWTIPFEEVFRWGWDVSPRRAEAYLMYVGAPEGLQTAADGHFLAWDRPADRRR